jgi:hypothetical protein
MGLREIVTYLAVFNSEAGVPEEFINEAITDILKLLPKERKHWKLNTDVASAERIIKWNRVDGYNQALEDVKKALVGDEEI